MQLYYVFKLEYLQVVFTIPIYKKGVKRKMEYKSYQHIEKLGSSEVEGILNGTCYLTYKIDGTNGCIYLSDDEKN